MTRKKEPLKMFVWTGVLTSYTDGLVCILAHNIEEAIEQAKKDFPDYVVEDFVGESFDVYTEPHAEYTYGGD